MTSLPLDHPFKRLEGQHTIILFDETDAAIYYRRLANSNWVLALGPLNSAQERGDRWVVPVFYSLLALAVFVWIRPLSRDLSALQQSASAFGEQDFSNRVAITDSSWLAPLGVTFNSMARRIQLLMRSHRELTQAVSHELRTPLARIRFSLEMMVGADTQTQNRHRDSINHDVEELDTLIDEMLNYAELSQDNMVARTEPIELNIWLREYLESYKRGDSHLPISLLNDGGSKVVMADVSLIKRALDNLLGNAQRYAKTRIELSVDNLDGYRRIDVCDDGPGIPREKRDAALAHPPIVDDHPI